MPVEERRRVALHRQVSATWGEEAAETLFDLITPAGHELATRRDVASLEARMDERFAAAQARTDGRFDVIEERLGALEHRLLAAFERRIADAVTTQTRTLVLSQLGALVVIAGLALGLR
jgi:hypothetical protein